MNNLRRSLQRSILALALVFWSTIALAQSDLPGKMYIAEISAACSEMTNGGCMTYTDCILSFEKDSVIVSYRSREYCYPESGQEEDQSHWARFRKTYAWSMKGNEIRVKGFETYGTFAYFDHVLTGKKEMNNTWIPLEFIEQR